MRVSRGFVGVQGPKTGESNGKEMRNGMETGFVWSSYEASMYCRA